MTPERDALNKVVEKMNDKVPGKVSNNAFEMWVNKDGNIVQSVEYFTKEQDDRLAMAERIKILQRELKEKDDIWKRVLAEMKDVV